MSGRSASVVDRRAPAFPSQLAWMGRPLVAGSSGQQACNCGRGGFENMPAWSFRRGLLNYMSEEDMICPDART
eukprot:4402785-Pleurochrysis_carterae.AAC.4